MSCPVTKGLFLSRSCLGAIFVGLKCLLVHTSAFFCLWSEKAPYVDLENGSFEGRATVWPDTVVLACIGKGDRRLSNSRFGQGLHRLQATVNKIKFKFTSINLPDLF